MNALRLAVTGVCGRMGATVLRLAAGDPAWKLVAALEHSGNPRLGQDAGVAGGPLAPPLPITDRCNEHCDVLVDFSSPGACLSWAAWCAERRVALVSGTTGLDADQHTALERCAQQTPIVWSANMSIGVNALLALVRQAAAQLREGWDVELVESHHRRKQDAPSGTARMLLTAIESGRAAPATLAHGRRHDSQPRAADEIGVHALRLGGVVGEHEVHFASEGEVVSLRHAALNRDIFAAGALRAARWLVGRLPGLYSMRDVLA